MQRRDQGLARSLGLPLTKKVKEARVLLVGAGGIGCELLKNLVCSGFGSYNTISHPAPAEDPSSRKGGIVVIDLDTIDLSNLNRQFLFRQHHIKRPKAYIAKETAQQFNPLVEIEAHHASIFDKQYHVDFFEGFDLVFNALDNLAARRHVNRMCLAANVPLIESGTTGFSGQVQAIQKGVTECYDCNPKPVQKSFPICTIRSTPSQPIHCIVWAKSYLFPELFGTTEEEAADMAVTDGDNAEEVAKLKEEAAALKKVRSLMGKSEFAQEVFNKVFHDDIERLKSMAEMWQSRKPPESLQFQSLALDSRVVKQGQALSMQDQRPWTLLENIAVFCYSLDTLSNRARAGEDVIEFDKDDKDTLDLVAAAANLRGHCFGIAMHSQWEIKQMAGNIIPAIATSNALTASLCVLEAFKILRALPPRGKEVAQPATNHHMALKAQPTTQGLLGGAKMVFLQSKNTDRMITSQPLSAPKQDCPVCSPVYAKLVLPATDSTTLGQLVELLKAKVGYGEDFSIATGMGVVYDPDLEDNLEKSLGEVGISVESSEFITVTDDGDDAKVDLVLSTVGAKESEAGLGLVPEKIELPVKTKDAPMADEVVHGNSNGGVEAGGKRKREADDDDDDLVMEGAVKKAKSSAANGPIVVEEDGGAIVLD